MATRWGTCHRCGWRGWTRRVRGVGRLCGDCRGLAPSAFVLSVGDIARCPLQSLSPTHYRADGSCLCPSRAVRAS
jgi:hypothetical protein